MEQIKTAEPTPDEARRETEEITRAVSGLTGARGAVLRGFINGYLEGLQAADAKKAG